MILFVYWCHSPHERWNYSAKAKETIIFLGINKKNRPHTVAGFATSSTKILPFAVMNICDEG